MKFTIGGNNVFFFLLSSGFSFCKGSSSSSLLTLICSYLKYKKFRFFYVFFTQHWLRIATRRRRLWSLIFFLFHFCIIFLLCHISKFYFSRQDTTLLVERYILCQVRQSSEMHSSISFSLSASLIRLFSFAAAPIFLFYLFMRNNNTNTRPDDMNDPDLSSARAFDAIYYVYIC